ncbi:tryptophan dimethylallyltransferase family protein [Streptomyces sp. NPDC047017]|uniref:tryptophan dimethylallyltransferase family protein n=1 Tax=Streptomyces sp. NPDC047017 TaxID=3155024 RepID=UPI0033C5740D
MSAVAGGGRPPAAPTLGGLTGGQLRRLCAVAELSDADTDAYAWVLTESLGPVAERALDLPPPSPTFLSDDHTPVEFSLSFQQGSAPSLRMLVDPGCGAADLAGNGRIGLETVRAMAERWRFGTDSLDAVADLFLPDAPHGPLALWCALELRPGGVPAVKVYLNPSAHGPEHRTETVREALGRLGHHKGFAALPETDGYLFFALDLGDWSAPRAKVYLRHDGLSAVRAGRLSRMDPGPGAAQIEEFFRIAAGAGRDGVRLTRRPGQTCHSFTDPGAPWPSGFTLHVPVRDYSPHDGESLDRAASALFRHGMNAAPLVRALAAMSPRRPEDGVGMIAYLSLAHQQGRPPRVTTYLSCEAYAVRPPAGAARHPVQAVPAGQTAR